MSGCRCRSARENEDTVIEAIGAATKGECAKLLGCAAVFLGSMVVWVASGTPWLMIASVVVGVSAAWYGVLVLAGSAARAERAREAGAEA